MLLSPSQDKLLSVLNSNGLPLARQKVGKGEKDREEKELDTAFACYFDFDKLRNDYVVCN